MSKRREISMSFLSLFLSNGPAHAGSLLAGRLASPLTNLGTTRSSYHY